MIAPANPNHYEESDDKYAGDYGGGVSERRVSMEHTRLIERALREGWPIPEKYRPAIVKRQVRIATSKECTPREATSAAKCLAMMSNANVGIVTKLLDKVAPDLHSVEAQVQHRVTVQELLSTPEYAEFLRDSERNSDPRLAGANGHAGNGKPLDDGASRNGH